MAFNVTSGTADLYLIDLWRTSSIKANSGDGLTGTLISIRPIPADLGMAIVPGLCIISRQAVKFGAGKSVKQDPGVRSCILHSPNFARHQSHLFVPANYPNLPAQNPIVKQTRDTCELRRLETLNSGSSYARR